MADSNDLNLDLQDQDENIKNNKVEERLRNLSKAKTLAEEERNTEIEAKKKAELERDAALKEKDFYASFADTTSQYPAAKDHKDEIKAKVLAGYTVEDATVSVLAKQGKLTTPAVERDSAAGGSATTTATSSGGQKTVNEMSREDKLSALLEAEKRGDIFIG